MTNIPWSITAEALDITLENKGFYFSGNLKGPNVHKEQSYRFVPTVPTLQNWNNIVP